MPPDAGQRPRDPHRPLFHLTAPSGWLNDPNGLSSRDGTHHLFYQLNPYAPVHDRIHWGHASSTDLVRWVDEPVALAPDDDGPDRDGCWSGVCVDDAGVPTIVYSGHADGRELPCLAVGSPDLRSWTKDPANPVVPEPPPGVDVVAFRDHAVWREAGRWRQLVGAGVRGAGGTAFLYASDDLRTWELLGPLVAGSVHEPGRDDPLWTGSVWECVDLFHVGADGRSAPVGGVAPVEPGGLDVLVLSVWDEEVTHYPLYALGRYAGDRFVPRTWHRLDHGLRYFYAPQSMAHPDGRRVVFGWLQEGRGEAAVRAAGWSGVMSLPRVLAPRPDGSLASAPAAEVASLRAEEVPAGELGAAGTALDVSADVELPPGSSAVLELRATPDGEEVTRVLLSRGAAGGTVLLTLDRSRSSLDDEVDRLELAGAVPVADDGLVRLRVLVDRSALEVFANGEALTARVYPTRDDATGVRLTTDGRGAGARLSVWRMSDALPQRAPVVRGAGMPDPAWG